MIERIDVGNVEVSSSAKGLVFTIGDDLVRKLIGYVTNSCSDKTNVMIDINELIDVLNQEKLSTACYGFMEIMENSSKIEDDNGVDTEGLGKTPEGATEATVMSTPVGQYEDVHAETFEDVEAKATKSSRRKSKK